MQTKTGHQTLMPQTLHQPETHVRIRGAVSITKAVIAPLVVPAKERVSKIVRHPREGGCYKNSSSPPRRRGSRCIQPFTHIPPVIPDSDPSVSFRNTLLPESRCIQPFTHTLPVIPGTDPRVSFRNTLLAGSRCIQPFTQLCIFKINHIPLKQPENTQIHGN